MKVKDENATKKLIAIILLSLGIIGIYIPFSAIQGSTGPFKRKVGPEKFLSYRIYNFSNQTEQKQHRFIEEYSLKLNKERRTVRNIIEVNNATSVRNKYNTSSKIFTRVSVPEVSIDTSELIKRAKESVKENSVFKKASYLVPEDSNYFYNISKPLFMVDFYTDSKGQRVLFDLESKAKIKVISKDFSRPYICETIASYHQLDIPGCVPEFITVSSTEMAATDYWDEAVDFLNNQKGGKILTWWDYSPFLTAQTHNKVIPSPSNSQEINSVAQFYTENVFKENIEWLTRNSIDYIVLDHTLIGKYAAISQISQKGGGFKSIRSLDFFKKIDKGDKKVLKYCKNDGNSCEDELFQIFVPIKEGPKTKVISAPYIRYYYQDRYLPNLCTEKGLRNFKMPEEENKMPGCIAFDPLKGKQKIHYIPGSLKDSMFVNLYFMENSFSEKLKKVKEVQNGYIKIWKVI